MSTWITPVTDRTTNDVYRARVLSQLKWEDMSQEQKDEWNTTLKGMLNLSDLERIETNIHLLSDVIELNLTTREGNIPLLPTMSYWKNLIDNVSKIRARGYLYWDTPETPLFPINYFEQINDIEKILRDTYNIILTNLYYESVDEWHMGEDVGLIL